MTVLGKKKVSPGTNFYVFVVVVVVELKKKTRPGPSRTAT